MATDPTGLQQAETPQQRYDFAKSKYFWAGMWVEFTISEMDDLTSKPAHYYNYYRRKGQTAGGLVDLSYDLEDAFGLFEISANELFNAGGALLDAAKNGQAAKDAAQMIATDVKGIIDAYEKFAKDLRPIEKRAWRNRDDIAKAGLKAGNFSDNTVLVCEGKNPLEGAADWSDQWAGFWKFDWEAPTGFGYDIWWFVYDKFGVKL